MLLVPMPGCKKEARKITMEGRALRGEKEKKELFESGFSPWLNHINVWQKSTQYSNAIILIKKKNEAKKKWDLTTFLAKTETTQSRHVQ